ncbi:MAG: ATP-binding cassette domain-containing protein [Vicinamibacterales bacterium]
MKPVPAIRVDGLVKRYGAVEAVRGISVDIAEGEIFGLIGPDGAGKTTTFQVLAGVMEATGGRAEVFGQPAREARAHTGYLTQTFSLYPDLTVIENIRYLGDLRGTPREEVERRGMKYLRMFDMHRFTDRRAGQLSGGMKQKLALACALVPEPRVLLLDEPTTGVDPVSRREFWDTLAHLSVDGLTILVATPYLDEAERCHRVALMYAGAIQRIGTPASLRDRLSAVRLEVRTTDLGPAEQILYEADRNHANIVDVQRFGDRLDVLVHDRVSGEAVIRERLRLAGLPVTEIRQDTPTLENAFVAELRALGGVVEHPTFPGLHDHSDILGQVAIGAEQITKSFGTFRAVHDVSLTVKYGEVYGLLGANGAGKTTTIKMLCGLLDATSGRAELAGARRNLRAPAVRRQIGYMSQKFSLYEDMTVAENLAFFGGVYGVPEEERAAKVDWVLRFANLERESGRIVGSLPGGWKQRVAFGASIMHEPTVLFLDEPTSGVDPLARRSFWSLINRLSDAGTAILVTTHYLEEAEQCNRLGMMVAGELVAEGTPSEIKAAQGGTLVELHVNKPQAAADHLKTVMDRWRVSLFGDRLHVISDLSIEPATSYLREHLTGQGLVIDSLRESRFSLEDVFISIVEQARVQGKVAVDA